MKKIELIDRMVYAGLIGMGCVFVGSFIQKVIYPWAKHDWDYHNNYEIHRQQQLSHFQSQLIQLLNSMDEFLREAYKIHTDFRQVWHHYLESMNLYRQDLDQIDKECIRIRSLIQKLSDLDRSSLIPDNQPTIGYEYEKDILECELKSLKGLLMNRLYFSPNESI